MPNNGANAGNPVILVASFSIEARVTAVTETLVAKDLLPPPPIINSRKPPVFSS